MSNQPAETPRDRRMNRRRSSHQQRRPESPTPGSVGDQPVAPTPEEGEEVVSRTLFSYLEPALDAIASFGPALVIAGIVGLVVGITLVAFVGALRLYGYITIGIGVVLIGLIALISLSSVFSAFVGRTGRYGINSLIMLAAFTGIIIVANFISFENHRRIDATATKQFSLATRSKQLLKELDQPVRATAFFISDVRKATRDPREQPQEVANQILRRTKTEETLREFNTRSSKFSFRFIDPDLDPESARKYAVSRYETVVVEGMNSQITSKIEPSPFDPTYSQLEQNLVTSLLVVTGKERKAVYFLAGHDERSTDSSASDGYSSVRAGLERDNYEVRTLRWDPVIEEVEVPKDAALVVIAGPRQALPQAHARALDRFLSGKHADGSDRREGGRLIALADPDTPDSFREFLSRWGVQANSGYILDLDQSVPGQPQTLRLGSYQPAVPDITRPRGTPLGITLMPGAASLTLINDGLRSPVPLAATSANSFLIKDISRNNPITEGDQADPKGRFLPAVYVQSLGPVGSRAPTQPPTPNQISTMIVFGDSDFISNSFFQRPSSGPDFFLNSANYLLGDVSLVSIRPKALTFREFNLDRNEHNFVRFSSWLFLPGLMGLMAALVWWLRR